MVRHLLPFFLLSLAVTCACRSSAATDAQTPGLRIHNRGQVPIADLHVFFPDQELTFGDIAAGATTAYKAAPRGVFNGAAYSFLRDGQRVGVPVVDWFGEKPLEGRRFTFEVEYDFFDGIRLLAVRKDK